MQQQSWEELAAEVICGGRGYARYFSHGVDIYAFPTHIVVTTSPSEHWDWDKESGESRWMHFSAGNGVVLGTRHDRCPEFVKIAIMAVVSEIGSVTEEMYNDKRSV